MSFPRHVGQVPLYYNHLNTGRPFNEGAVFYSHHMDVDKSPLFPFGHGLSYTTFDFSNFKAEVQDNEVKVSATVSNTGATDGHDVVQVYVRDVAAFVSRPVNELKAFEKVFIKAGGQKEVLFALTKEDLSFYSVEGKLIFEPGEFHISLGHNSRDLTTQSITF